jgi:hypothetical protein
MSMVCLATRSCIAGGFKNGGGADGFTAKSFGAREVTYRLMFIACNTLVSGRWAG